MVTIRIGDAEESLSWEQWEQRVRDGRIPPSALVCFEPVTGTDFIPAQELDLFHSLHDDARRAWSDRYRAGSPPWMTALIVGVQIRLWWLMRMGSWDDLRDALQLWQPTVLEDGEVWRMFTAGFTHWSIGHILSNLVMLVYIGWFLERALGRLNFLAIFLLSVLGGSVLSMSLTPDSSSIGASGGVMGIVAAATVFGFVRFGLLPDRARIVFGWALLPYLLLIYGMGWMSESTDNWAHTGGLVTGAFLALLLDPPGLERRKHWNTLFLAGSLGGVAVLLAGIWWAGPSLLRLDDVAHRRRDFDPTRHRELVFAAPNTWRSGRTDGLPTYESPAFGRRSFGAVVRERSRPTTPEAVLTDWREDLEETWGDQVAFSPTEEVALAGTTTLHQVATLDDGLGAELERWVATRGVYVLEVGWSVDLPVKSRLSGVRQRALDSVQWNEPTDLLEAEDAVEGKPSSRPLRRKLAQELAHAGRVDEALAIWEALIEERSATPDGWMGLLELLIVYPDAVDDREAVYRRALDAAPSPQIVADVALALHEDGQEERAIGLLEASWTLDPGDRHVRRARKVIGLPTELVGTVPAHLLAHPRTGAPLDAPRRTAEDVQIDLDAAPALGRQVLTERRAVASTAIDAPWPLAIPRLLLARDGHLPELEELDGRLQAVATDVGALAQGGQVPWLSDRTTDALRARLELDALDRNVLRAPDASADPEAFAAWLDRLGIEAVDGPRGPSLQIRGS